MTTRHYLGIAEPGPKNWSISFPAFPGTVSMGDTFADVMANARDALASVIEAMQENAEEISDSFNGSLDSQGYDAKVYENPHIVLLSVEIGGKAQRINVTMDEGLIARVDHFAERAKTTRSAVLAKGARMVLASEAAE